MTPASWEVERQHKHKVYEFKNKIKQLNIQALSIIEFKDAVERIYVEVYYPEERI